MMETGLESIAYNINRRNTDIQFFEFGKTYTTTDIGKYKESNTSLYLHYWQKIADGWKAKQIKQIFILQKVSVKRS